MHVSRLAPLTILAASLVPMVFGLGGGSFGQPLPECRNGDGTTTSNKRWYSELEIPVTTGDNPKLFEASLKRKLANHDVVFNMSVMYGSNVKINIQNGHGNTQNYRVNFKNGRNEHIKSYQFTSNSGECESPGSIVKNGEVWHVTVEMENRW